MITNRMKNSNFTKKRVLEPLVSRLKYSRTTIVAYRSVIGFHSQRSVSIGRCPLARCHPAPTSGHRLATIGEVLFNWISHQFPRMNRHAFPNAPAFNQTDMR